MDHTKLSLFTTLFSFPYVLFLSSESPYISIDLMSWACLALRCQVFEFFSDVRVRVERKEGGGSGWNFV